MTNPIYGFRSPPTYRPSDPGEMWQAAMDMPLSPTSTFFDQAKGGVLESFGLGTAIRDLTTPEGKVEDDGWTIDDFVGAHPALRTYDLAKRAAQWFINDPESPALSEDAYKASQYFREGIPWDSAMTEDRAASLAMAFDARKVREYYGSKRPITAFIGNLAGQATDPINYVPVAGPLVKAAAVARLGRVAGASVAASLDAAANTAIFGLATANQRRRYGDDVSWQTTVSQIATAALIGAGFGAIGGAIEGRGAQVSRSAIEERLATLKNTQEARIALNEGIDALAKGEDLNLSPNATQAVSRVQNEIIAYHGSPHSFDAFSMDKLGSGEGAQAYGRGLYFAESERVARSYQSALSEHPFPDGDEANIAYTLLNSRGEEKARELLGGTRSSEEVDALIEKAKGAQSGNLYEVGIRADEEEFLDWDKPLDEQPPAIQEKMLAAGYSIPSKDLPAKSRTVGATASREFQKPEEIARLKEAGIPGIKFLDYGSRGSGEGTRNFVLFDDQLVRIRARNGQPIDTTLARPDAPPEGLPQAASAVGKPDDYKAMSSQYRVDPETGAFDEEADIAQLAAEGRLTEEDTAVMADAQATYEDGAAYGEALKSVAGCLI